MLGSRVRAPEGAHHLKANSMIDIELAFICVDIIDLDYLIELYSLRAGWHCSLIYSTDD